MADEAEIVDEVVNDAAEKTAADTGADNGGKQEESNAAADDKAGGEGAANDVQDGGDKQEDKPAALPDNWREIAAGSDETALKLLKRYGSLGGVVKALQEAQNTIRSGKIKRDMPDAKDEKAMSEWRKEQGIPEKPEGYTLSDAVTKRLVDEDKPILASFTEFAHTKNLPTGAVEVAAEWYVNLQEHAAEAQAAKDAEASEAVDDALRDVWARDEFKGNLSLAKRYMESAGGIGAAWTEARLPDGRRLGDIAEFVQWASDQGRQQFGDTVFASADSEARHNNRKAEIEKIRDTDFDRYEREGLNKEYLGILEKELKRGKR